MKKIGILIGTLIVICAIHLLYVLTSDKKDLIIPEIIKTNPSKTKSTEEIYQRKSEQPTTHKNNGLNDTIKLDLPKKKKITKKQKQQETKKNNEFQKQKFQLKFVDSGNLLPLRNLSLLLTETNKPHGLEFEYSTDKDGRTIIEIDCLPKDVTFEADGYQIYRVEDLNIDSENIIALNKSPGLLIKLRDQYGYFVPNAEINWTEHDLRQDYKSFVGKAKEIKKGMYLLPTITEGSVYIFIKKNDHELLGSPSMCEERKLFIEVPKNKRRELDVDVKRKTKIELRIQNPKEDLPKKVRLTYKNINLDKIDLQLEGNLFKGYISTEAKAFRYEAMGFEPSPFREAQMNGPIFEDSIYLTKGSRSLSVLVVDDNGEPIHKVKIEIGQDSISDRQVTDYQGKVYFTNLNSQKHFIQAGYSFHNLWSGILEAGDSKKDSLKIVLPRQLNVKGQVLTKDGKPVSSVKLFFEHINTEKLSFSPINRSKGEMNTCKSDFEGKFELKLPIGFLYVKIKSKDYAHLYKKIKINPTNPFLSIELESNERKKVRGLVVDEHGNNLKNFQLQCYTYYDKNLNTGHTWRNIKTNQQGEFEIDCETKKIIKFISNQKNWLLTKPIKVSNLEKVDITVYQAPKVIFNIISEAGLELENIKVYIDIKTHSRPDNIELQKLKANQYQASFQNRNDVPLPRLPLQAFIIKSKNHQEYRTEFIDPYSKQGNHEMDIALKLGRSLRIRVTDEDGIALSNVNAYLSTVNKKSSLGFPHGVPSNESGIIEINSLPDELLLSINHDGYQYYSEKFITNLPPIEETIVLKKGAEMKGRVIGFNKYKNKIRSLDITGKYDCWERVRVEKDGSFKIPNLAEGKYSLKYLPRNKMLDRKNYILVHSFDFVRSQVVEIDLTKLKIFSLSEDNSEKYELEQWKSEGEVDFDFDFFAH